MNSLEKFALPKEGIEKSFEHKGVTVTMRGKPWGEDYFEVVFPDPAEAFRECRDMAAINNRTRNGVTVAYPSVIYGDIIAIERSLVTPEGETPLDRSSIFKIYDEDPKLFSLLIGTAVRVLGIQDEIPTRSGKAAWSEVQIILNRIEVATVTHQKTGSFDSTKTIAEVRALKRIVHSALKDFQIEVPEDGEDEFEPIDKMMEGQLKNSPGDPETTTGND